MFDKMDECSEAEVQRLKPLVSAQRREQATRYKHTFGQYCCLKSWLMLDELLCHNRGAFVFQYNKYGKPFLSATGQDLKDKLPYFSISHCKDGIAVAIDDEPIGIDIESIRTAQADLIERVMNDEEQQLIYEAAEPDRVFIKLWTQKEAIVKAQGTGIESFEQLAGARNTEYEIQTFESKKYIYSIAFKQH